MLECVSVKNIYADPFDPYHLCFITNLRIVGISTDSREVHANQARDHFHFADVEVGMSQAERK